MARKKKTLPAVADDFDDTPGDSAAVVAADPVADTAEAIDGGKFAEFLAPLGDIPPDANDRPLHLPQMHLTRQQSEAIRQLRLGLQGEKAICEASGGRKRLVDSHADVVRWLLEQV